MRAAIDTNVLLSGLFWRGTPHALIELCLISSPMLLAELAEVIYRPKFQATIAKSDADPGRMLEEVRQLVEIIDPPQLSTPVSRDPDDDAVLAVAVASQADMIITGDADLLALGTYDGIAIVDPAAALARIVSS